MKFIEVLIICLFFLSSCEFGFAALFNFIGDGLDFTCCCKSLTGEKRTYELINEHGKECDIANKVSGFA